MLASGIVLLIENNEQETLSIGPNTPDHMVDVGITQTGLVFDEWSFPYLRELAQREQDRQIADDGGSVLKGY